MCIDPWARPSLYWLYPGHWRNDQRTTTKWKGIVPATKDFNQAWGIYVTFNIGKKAHQLFKGVFSGEFDDLRPSKGFKQCLLLETNCCCPALFHPFLLSLHPQLNLHYHALICNICAQNSSGPHTHRSLNVSSFCIYHFPQSVTEWQIKEGKLIKWIYPQHFPVIKFFNICNKLHKSLHFILLAEISLEFYSFSLLGLPQISFNFYIFNLALGLLCLLY